MEVDVQWEALNGRNQLLIDFALTDKKDWI